MPYFVVRDIVLHVLYAAVVPYRDIMQRSMVEPRMLLHPSRKRKFLSERAEPYVAGEAHGLHEFSRKII